MGKDYSFLALVNDSTLQINRSGNKIRLESSDIEASIERTGPSTYSLLLKNASFDSHVEKQADKLYKVTINGNSYAVKIGDKRDILLEKLGFAEKDQSTERDITAPMPGLVLAVHTNVGDVIEEGAGLLILEAMKMENEIKAPTSGSITAIHVSPGVAVKKHDLLIEIGPVP